LKYLTKEKNQKREKKRIRTDIKTKSKIITKIEALIIEKSIDERSVIEQIVAKKEFSYNTVEKWYRPNERHLTMKDKK
jgi:hypothetical protein